MTEATVPYLGVEPQAAYGHMVRMAEYCARIGDHEYALRAGFQAGVTAWTQLVGKAWCDDDLERVLSKVGIALRNAHRPKGSPLPPTVGVDVLGIVSTLADYGGHSVMFVNWMRTLKNAGYTVATLNTRINPGDTAPERIAELQRLGAYEELDAAAPYSGRTVQVMDHLNGPKLLLLATNPQDVMVQAALGSCIRGAVLYLDHADHVWWLGKTTLDKVVEYRQQGIDNALHQRGVDISRVCAAPLLCGYLPHPKVDLPTLPSGVTGTVIDGADIRRKLNIPKDGTWSLTVATVYKLLNAKRPEWEYVKVISDMLRRNRAHHHILILNADVVQFRTLVPSDIRGKFHVIGPVSHDALGDYYAQCDFLIESFPFPGATVRYEALSQGLPIIPVDTGDNPNEIELMGLPDYAHICREPSEFHTSTQDFIINPGLLRSAELASKEWFEQHLSRDLVEQAMLDCCREYLR
jgi:hypothetical protein